MLSGSYGWPVTVMPIQAMRSHVAASPGPLRTRQDAALSTLDSASNVCHGSLYVKAPPNLAPQHHGTASLRYQASAVAIRAHSC